MVAALRSAEVYASVGSARGAMAKVLFILPNDAATGRRFSVVKPLSPTLPLLSAPIAKLASVGENNPTDAGTAYGNPGPAVYNKDMGLQTEGVLCVTQTRIRFNEQDSRTRTRWQMTSMGELAK